MRHSREVVLRQHNSDVSSIRIADGNYNEHLAARKQGQEYELWSKLLINSLVALLVRTICNAYIFSLLKAAQGAKATSTCLHPSPGSACNRWLPTFSRQVMCGFPRIRALFRSPYNKDPSILCSVLEPLIFWKLTYVSAP